MQATNKKLEAIKNLLELTDTIDDCIDETTRQNWKLHRGIDTNAK